MKLSLQTAHSSPPVHRHASAKSNSPLSDDHMHLGSRSRKRNRKEMSHNKMLCLCCYLVFGLFGLLSDSPPTWFPSYSSKHRQAGLAHSFKAQQEPRMTITISPEVQQHDQHQQAMWDEHRGPMLLDKQAARKLKIVSCLTTWLLDYVCTNPADKQKCSYFDVAAYPSWHGSVCLNQMGCPTCLWSA